MDNSRGQGPHQHAERCKRVFFFRVFSHSTVPKLLLIFEAAGCIRLQNQRKDDVGVY